MDAKDFDNLMESRFAKSRKVLATKAMEYSSDKDRLHSFKRAGDVQSCSPAKALIGMWTKHLVSIFDLVDELEADPTSVPSARYLDEKIGDTINYAILLEAAIAEEAFARISAESEKSE